MNKAAMDSLLQIFVAARYTVLLCVCLGMETGEGNGNPLQCSCLENPMDGGARQSTVHGVAKSWTQLSEFTIYRNENTGAWGRYTFDFRRHCQFSKVVVPSYHPKGCVSVGCSAFSPTLGIVLFLAILVGVGGTA